MNATILDSKSEGTATCFLVKILLEDYIDNLSEDYKDYEIQREIVTNTYLDNLVDTVLKKKHIPPIVLIVQNIGDNKNSIKMNSFKILDGLQRTYRLNAIWKTLNFFKNIIDKDKEILSLSRYALSKKYSAELASFDSSIRILQTVITYYNSNSTKEGFDLFYPFNTNFQWFEVWHGLTAEEEVAKMLVLNAGHKPVKIKHQLELIFRNLIPILGDIGFKNFKIFREKEISAVQFSKTREVGHFHFSHIIASILSFKDGSPVTTNSAFIQKLQNSDFDADNDSKYFTYSFLTDFIETLIKIDTIIEQTYHDLGVKWMGREVTLVGMFGALGHIAELKKIGLNDALGSLAKKITSRPLALNLTKFEEERNRLDLSKVNIGNANKNAIFNAFVSYLEASDSLPIAWTKYFNN